MIPETGEPGAAVLVVGGGIGGMRAALDLADAGLKAYLVEQTASLGGRVAHLGFMFPQHDCVLCRGTSDHGYGCTRPSISPAYLPHNRHPNIHILTNARVVDVQGQAGDFSISIRQEPRYVDPDRCTNCGLCSEVCPVELPDGYQLGMTTRKAVGRVAIRAIPDSYTVDRGPYCDTCGKCAAVCPTKAIDLSESARLIELEVGAILLAVGFDPYDATRLEELGHGRYVNVLSAMQYERLASRSGPTEGFIRRPSNGQAPRSIAWLQCIGSRDRRRAYCSSVCCMYATKEAVLAKQRLGPNVRCSIFQMDERAFNKEYSKYHAGAREQYNIEYHRCRVSAVYEDPETKDLILRYAHISGRISKERYELVVLANGVEPPANAPHLAEVFGFELNRHGFCRTNKFTPLQTSRPGVFVCGTFAAPKEISETILDASGAAAEIIRFLNHRINTNPHSKVWPFRASVSGRLLQLEDIDHRPPRTGVFLCSCGGTIGKVIDLEALRDKAVRMPAVAQAEIIEFACLPEGRARIQDEIKRHSLNRVVVAACSARTHQALFQRTVVQSGLNPYLLETSNLREQCAQVHQGEPERAARKAGEMLRVAVARVAIAQPIHKLRAPCLSSALVIGGGVAGMTAALAIADSGYDVHLVEREDVLGGNLRDLSYVAEGSDPQKLLRDLLTRIRSHQKIKTYTRAKVIGHSGQVGRFRTELVIRLADGTSTHTTLEHAVTVIATGARESRNHPLLQHPGIMTQRQLEETIVRHPEKTDALREVVMIQCVRPEGTPPYCSRLCCTNALKNAVRLKLLNPSCRVTVLYKDIVAYGFREEFYTNAREHGVVFIRYTDECPPRVSTEGNRLSVIARDLALNRELVLPADVVALSMAITTGPETVELARTLGVPLSAEGFFAEAQLKLRPMDFTREGVFLAGMAQYPKFLEESISHALAAAGRAISILSQDSVHLGPIVARVDSGKCVGCLTCVRVCPFGAPRVVAEEGRTGVGGLGGAAFIDPTLCQGCGTCTAECPANAIELDNFSDQQVMLPHINGLGTWQ